MDVSILIITYNSEDQIAGCLESVYRQRVGISQEIIVVDNSSSDGTVNLIRRHFPEVILKTPRQNLGFAAGVNEAAKYAKGDFLLLLNPDAEVLDHAIEKIYDFACSNPKFGFYGGRTVKSDGSLEPFSCMGLPSLWSMLLFASGVSGLAKRSSLLNPEAIGGWERDSTREVGAITGCFLLVARSIWEKVGGFDTRFFMYGEDVDLAIRARRLGYRPIIFPEATIRHDMGQSSETSIARLLLLYRGKATLLRSHWKGIFQMIGIGLLLTGVWLRACLAKYTKSFVGINNRNGWIALWERKNEWIRGYPYSVSDTSTPVTSR